MNKNVIIAILAGCTGGLAVYSWRLNKILKRRTELLVKCDKLLTEATQIIKRQEELDELNDLTIDMQQKLIDEFEKQLESKE